MSRARLEGWRSIQERREDSAIESDERVNVSRAVVPFTEAGARILGERSFSAAARAFRRNTVTSPRKLDACRTLAPRADSKPY